MKSIEIGNPDLVRLLDDITGVAGYFWQRAWAERNGGNISVNVSQYFRDEIEDLGDYPFHTADIRYPRLAGGSFFITGTGKRMRDMARQPEGNGCILQIARDLKGYRVIWGAGADPHIEPTSEFPSHLAIHDFLLRKKTSHRVILHTHPTHLIALTHCLDRNQEDRLNRILWTMHPEMKIFVPRGVGIVPYRLPGSEAIARATVRKLAHHRVVLWEKHGILATGEEVMETFDIIDMLNKAAEIYLMCKNAGFEPSGLSDQQLAELETMGSQWQE
jgi:rhamnulose-1-phosphate aldolase